MKLKKREEERKLREGRKRKNKRKENARCELLGKEKEVNKNKRV